VHLQDASASLVQPGDDEDLVTRLDPVESVEDGRLELDQRVGCTLVALAQSHVPVCEL
jgi:hypothetical protein